MANQQNKKTQPVPNNLPGTLYAGPKHEPTAKIETTSNNVGTPKSLASQCISKTAGSTYEPVTKISSTYNNVGTPKSTIKQKNTITPPTSNKVATANINVGTTGVQQVIDTCNTSITVRTDKNVYVNVNENITEQKYIRNGGSSLSVSEDGSLLSSTVSNLNFVGSGVTAQATTTGINVTVPGGGSIGLDQYCSIAIGNGLSTSTGLSNFAFGCNTMVGNTTGSDNIAIGSASLNMSTNTINVLTGLDLTASSNIYLDGVYENVAFATIAGPSSLTIPTATVTVSSNTVSNVVFAEPVYGVTTATVLGTNQIPLSSSYEYTYSSQSIPNQILGSTGLETIYSGDLVDDDFWQLTLPFTWNFLGINYTTMYFGSNGYITFGDGSTIYNPVDAASPALPKILIAGCDQKTSAVYAGVEGVAPSRKYRIRVENFDSYGELGTEGQQNFEVTFYEGTGTFDLQTDTDFASLVTTLTGVATTSQMILDLGIVAANTGTRVTEFGALQLPVNSVANASLTIENTVSIGSCTLTNLVGGCNNNFIGVNSGCNLLVGCNNTIIGNLPVSQGLSNTVMIGAGTCERVKVDNTGLYVNCALFGATPTATPTSTGTVIGYTGNGYNAFFGCCAGNTTMFGCNNTGIGVSALLSNTTGCSNVAIGRLALASNTAGCCNTATGVNALSYNTIGNFNTATGVFSMLSNTEGTYNTATGACSLYYNTTGCLNTAIGASSLFWNTTGNSNTAMGACSLFCNTTGNSNTAIGTNALICNTIGDSNTAIGSNALYGNTTGYNNTAIGSYALYRNTTGYYNTAIGGHTLFCNTTGYFNAASGTLALYNNTTGYNNTAMGAQTLHCNTNGSGNTAVGESALHCNLSGTENTAIGSKALYGNTTGSYNTAIGVCALQYNTTGVWNTAIGWAAMRCNTSGSNNTVLGMYALYNNSAGTGNTVVGINALYQNTTGSANAVVGMCALNHNTLGSYNTATGFGSLYCNTSGCYNIAVGHHALRNADGLRNIAIGAESGCLITTGTNNTIIGSLTAAAGCVCTLLLGAGTCERVKVDNTGLYVNGTLFTGGASPATPTVRGTVYGCTGICDVLIGRGIVGPNYTGGCNIGMGAGVFSKHGGSGNISLGSASMFGTLGGFGYFNVAMGDSALYCINNGSCNIAIGYQSQLLNKNGVGNISVGAYALQNNNFNGSTGDTGGCYNTAIGDSALNSNTTGNYNVSVGACSLSYNATGSNNVALGNGSLRASVASSNIGIGCNSGCLITTGASNTVIGSLPGTAGLTCTLLLGAGTTERLKVDSTGMYINGGSLFTNGSAITLKNTYEIFTSLTGATGTVTHDFANGSIFSHTSIAANFTVNITNLGLATLAATNITLILNQGATAYIPNAVQIAGVAQTISWQGGSAPSGNASKIDIVNFSITNIAGTYQVFGQLTTFG